MNISKWLPKQNNDIIKIFEQNRQLERSFRVLGKKFATDINLDLPDYYVCIFVLLLSYFYLCIKYDSLLHSVAFQIDITMYTIFHLANTPQGI